MMCKHLFPSRQTGRWQLILGFRSLMATGLACLLLGASMSHAATAGYWRFEDSPGFLEDSSGNGLSLSDNSETSVIVSQDSIPATGPGSDFDALAGNASFATFVGGPGGFARGSLSSAAPAASFIDFTVEAFVNIASLVDPDAEPPVENLELITHIVAQYEVDSGIQDKSWSLAVNKSATNSKLQPGELYMLASDDGINTPVVNSFLTIELDKDYYLAASFDSDAGIAGIDAEVTFYAKNLTDGTPMQVVKVNRDIEQKPGQVFLDTTILPAHPSSQDITIGSLATFNTLVGAVDEVRLSDVALSNSGLLIPGPAAVNGDFDGDLDVDGADILRCNAGCVTRSIWTVWKPISAPQPRWLPLRSCRSRHPGYSSARWRWPSVVGGDGIKGDH